MQMTLNDFLMKKLKCSKNLKNLVFLRFYQIFEVTFDMGSVEQIDKWLHFQAQFFMKFDRKILTALLIMNECITSKKKPLKLYKGQHFFEFQLAKGAPVLLEAGGKPST